MASMNSLKAKVQDGRLIHDEPTDLADGTVVELVEADPYAHLDDADDLDDEERAKLHKAIDRGRAELEAGQGIPAEEFVKEIKPL